MTTVERARWVARVGASLLALLAAPSVALGQDLPSKTGLLNEPFLEWEVAWDGAEGNPYDVVAHATFTHEASGEEKRSLMYHAGGDAWRFRFTGTRPGTWHVRTSGPGALGGREGRVSVEADSARRKGFLSADGPRWVWRGTGEEHVPHLAMSKHLAAYWTDEAVDTAAIDADVEEFIEETGFTGFHKAGVGGQWFDVTLGDDDTDGLGPDVDPDPRAFDVMEAFIIRAYEAGASTHIWLWGSDAYKVGWGARGGPDGIGGPTSAADRRLGRYLAARMGPIPGWSMGYGYDLQAYIDAEGLQRWYGTLKHHLGGWEHLIGARADFFDTWDRDVDPDGDGYKGISYHSEMAEGSEAVFWTGGDYIGLYDYRVPYAWYRKTRAFAGRYNKPVLQEDRFRIRESDRWFVKDYTPELTRRGLWHAMMAGGVGGIWGNLLPEADHGGSVPYDSRGIGSIQDVRNFEVDVKDELGVWRDFWYGGNRFRSGYVVANELTNDEPGLEMWDTSPTGGPIAVALRTPDNAHFVFYREEASALRMDLRAAAGPLPAVAFNARTGETRDLGLLEPQLYPSWRLGGTVTDWAVAVGDFGAPAPASRSEALRSEALRSEASPSEQGLRLEKEGTDLVYFSYGGEPLLSFGGLSDFTFYAAEDAYDYRHWADWAAEHGMNHVRAYLPLSWKHVEHWTEENGGDLGNALFPYEETTPGSRQFDLARFDEAYWDRFREKMAYFRDKGLVVHLIMMNGWQITHDPELDWGGHFFNPANNVNAFTDHLEGDKHAFYFSVADGHDELAEAQRAFLRKIIDETADLGNVYYDLVHEITRYRGGGWITEQEAWPKVQPWIEAMAEAVREHYGEAQPDVPVILGMDAGPLSDEHRDWLFRQPFFDVLIWGKRHDVEEAKDWRRTYDKPYIPQESWDDNGSKWSYRVPNHAVHLRKYFWKFTMAKAQQLDFYMKPRSESQAPGSINPPGYAHNYDPEGWSPFEEHALVLRSFWEGLRDYPNLGFAGRVAEGPGAHRLALSSAEEAVLYLSSATGETDVPYEAGPLAADGLALRDGRYRVVTFDPERGAVEEGEVAVEGGRLSLPLPAFTDDLALHVHRR